MSRDDDAETIHDEGCLCTIGEIEHVILFSEEYKAVSSSCLEVTVKPPQNPLPDPRPPTPPQNLHDPPINMRCIFYLQEKTEKRRQQSVQPFVYRFILFFYT